MLMPPLIEKWNALKDTDKDLFPLLEVCSVSVSWVAVHTENLKKSGELTLFREKSGKLGKVMERQ